GARNQAVQNWVGRWDIRIYAFEQFPARLVPLAIGEYDILHRKEVEFFIDNPDYFSALFENSADKLDELRTLKEQID
ncbi:hypothetical protein KDK77_08405, partial [bacterium]|nr:hypothetical protein [bacterium]